jgi:hypothetical protein
VIVKGRGVEGEVAIFGRNGQFGVVANLGVDYVKVEVFRCFRRQQDPRRWPEVEDDVG